MLFKCQIWKYEQGWYCTLRIRSLSWMKKWPNSAFSLDFFWNLLRYYSWNNQAQFFFSPHTTTGCKPEQQMMYAGSKNKLVQTAELTKVCLDSWSNCPSSTCILQKLFCVLLEIKTRTLWDLVIAVNRVSFRKTEDSSIFGDFWIFRGQEERRSKK